MRNGDLILSKVNGVTPKTVAALLSRDKRTTLESFIVSSGLLVNRTIWVAQSFNTKVGSNHAEACIMAAAGPGEVTYINCTGPHCGFCFAMMEKDNVACGEKEGDLNQTGWAHPFGPVSFGKQRSRNLEGQLAELKALPVVPEPAHKETVQVGQWLFSKPKGRKKRWLSTRFNLVLHQQLPNEFFT